MNQKPREKIKAKPIILDFEKPHACANRINKMQNYDLLQYIFAINMENKINFKLIFFFYQLNCNKLISKYYISKALLCVYAITMVCYSQTEISLIRYVSKYLPPFVYLNTNLVVGVFDVDLAYFGKGRVSILAEINIYGSWRRKV